MQAATSAFAKTLYDDRVSSATTIHNTNTTLWEKLFQSCFNIHRKLNNEFWFNSLLDSWLTVSIISYPRCHTFHNFDTLNASGPASVWGIIEVRNKIKATSPSVATPGLCLLERKFWQKVSFERETLDSI